VQIIDTFRFITSHPLTRAHRFSALGRYLRWQIVSRIARGPVVFPWVAGARFLVRSGETGLTGNVYVGLHEFEEMAFLLHYLRRDELFVDVGANVGSYTILAGAVCGARVVAFEPIATTFARLVANVRLNGLEGRVECVPRAAGARAGHLRITASQDTTNHVLARGEDDRENVEVAVEALDSRLAGRSPGLLKIDVEGFETEVLRGATGVISDPTLKAIILELNGSGDRYGYDEALIPIELGRHGFEVAEYRPFERVLDTSRPFSSQSQNKLFIRDFERVGQRLASAPRIEVLGLRL